jgi:DNA-binding XRE family transcriptional regulator
VKPYQLINKLVEAEGGSLPVAKAMKAPSFQGTLHKFINGHVDSPSRSTAERIARHFRIPVDAVYDEKLAAKIALERKIELSHGNVDTQAQPLSHPPREDAPTAAEVGGGQLPVSFDAVFAKMRPSEQKRLLFMFAAAFDDPPDPTDHIGGIPQWDQSKQAPGASPGKSTPAKTAPGKDKHRRLG